MNKLDNHPPALAYPVAPQPDSETGRRLIVLFSESETDPALAARKILDMASSFRCPVTILGLCKNQAEESGLRRQMVTLIAMLEDSIGPIESKIEFGTNWLDLVRSNWRNGDVLVCFAGQRAGVTHRPLSQILETNLSATVYIIADSQLSQPARANWLSPLLAWSGSIAIILGFFWLQAKLVVMPKDFAHTILLMLSMPVEVWLVWMWNSLIG